MYTPYCSKNNYVESKRNFLDDYSNIESKKVNMTLSGKFLSEYPNFEVDFNTFCSYPLKKEQFDLIEKIKYRNKITTEVLLGPGSNGLLQNLVKVYIKPGDNLVTPFYTFNQAEYATTALGGVTRRVKCDKYKINFNNLRNSIDDNTKIVYICNPNNPTGIYLCSKELISFSKSIKPIIIVDESGIEFTNRKSILEYSNLPDNLIVLRSFSKAYGLANLRVGYMVCSQKVKDNYIKKNTTNEISGLSITFAKHMMENYSYVLKNIKLINEEKCKLISELKKLDVEVIKSDSNTIMSKTTFSQKVFDDLLLNDVSIVTIFDEYNKIHFRIAVQDEKTNKIFIEKLKYVLSIRG